MKHFIPFASLLLCSVFLLSSHLLLSQDTRSIMHEGIERTFIHFTPEQYTGEEPRPLVFLLHGFTQNADAIMNYSAFNAVAEEQNVILVYPNGLDNAWNTNPGSPGGSTADDVGFLSQLIDLISSEQNIDSRRVYACGFSAGGFMSYILACELQDQLAAVASVAGTYSREALDNCTPDRAFPILHIHGTDDIIVPPAGGFGTASVNETLDFWVGQNGCQSQPQLTEWPDEANDGTLIEQYDFLSCQAGTEIQYLRVIGGGHTWPDAEGQSGLGTTTRNLNASEEIWNFFSRHQAPISTQVSDPTSQTAKIFPNPVGSQLQMEIPADWTHLPYQIIGADGRLIQSGRMPQTLLKLSVGDWVPGTYFIKIEGQKTLPWVKK